MNASCSPRNSKACPTKGMRILEASGSRNTSTTNQTRRAHQDAPCRSLKTSLEGTTSPMMVADSSKKDPRSIKTALEGSVGARPTLNSLMGLSTSNSEFLSHLFADVAQAKDEILQTKRAATSIGTATATSPWKRRRISVLSTSSNSSSELPSPSSRSGSTTGSGSLTVSAAVKQEMQINRPLDAAADLGKDSHQKKNAPFLDLLWEESWLAPALEHPALSLNMRKSVEAFCAPNVRRSAHQQAEERLAVAVIEPDLPASVAVSDASMDLSNSCCKSHRQENALVSSSLSPTKDESFGWFVSMDEDDDEEDCTMLDSSANGSRDEGLAFSSSRRSSKASNHEAEVAWAKAADTVDDVLGDLF